VETRARCAVGSARGSVRTDRSPAIEDSVSITAI
jgi:hypothetical protein